MIDIFGQLFVFVFFIDPIKKKKFKKKKQVANIVLSLSAGGC